MISAKRKKKTRSRGWSSEPIGRSIDQGGYCVSKKMSGLTVSGIGDRTAGL